MPKIDDVYESKSKFLKVEDLQGKKVAVTISEVTIEQIGDDRKFVLHFEGKEKVLVLNVTNARMLEMLTESDDSDAWVGLTITLKRDMTTYQGKPTPCIRIDSDLPEQKHKERAKAATASVDDSEIPF